MRVHRRSGGFTIVELVIVIAMIALLVAILVPVFMRGREQAVKTTCAGNMSQLGTAFSMYLQDWNGIYPSPGGLVGDKTYWSQSANGGLVSYVHTNGGLGSVWCCPNLTEWSGPYPPRSYSMNSYMRDPPDIDYPGCVSITKGMPENFLENPRRTILLFEGLPIMPAYMSQLYYIYRCGNWTCTRGWYTKSLPAVHTMYSWKPWHGTRSNYLYCDGHLSSKAPDQYPKHPPYDRTNEWWVRKSFMTKKMNPWH